MFFRKKNNKDKLPIGWSGDFSSWEEASLLTRGYDQANILEKVKTALLKVKKGEAVYERDSVLFDKVQYSWPLLALLLRIASENGNRINLIDFGGSLGSTYFQCRNFIHSVSEVKWNVVEQRHFVETGKEYFASEELGFWETIEEAMASSKSNVLLASSVIQYIQQPYELLQRIKDFQFEYIIFDRTSFIDQDRDVITVQVVPPEVYEASYPAWFFNYKKFVDFFADKYELLADFDNGFTSPVTLNTKRAWWQGIIFKKIANAPIS